MNPPSPSVRQAQSPIPPGTNPGPADDFGAGSVLARIRNTARHDVREGAFNLEFQALGTRCRVAYAASGRFAKEIAAQILAWVADFEARYSRFLPDSIVSRINAAAGRDPVAIDPDTENLLALFDQAHFITRGALDASTLPLLRIWDWKAEPPVVPDADTIARARALCGWRAIRRTPGFIHLPVPGMGLDLGGIGKEFAVDQIAEFVSRQGVSGVLVDFGADVRVIGRPPDGRPGWHIGLDDPRQPGRCWCGLGLVEGAVATSGDYVRRFEIAGRRYGHILDPRTGRPVENGCLAVSVLGPNCTLAGILSTAVFVLGPTEGLRLVEAQMGFEAAVITEGGTHFTRRFQGYVATQA